ncbi:chemotaxis protein CheR [Paraburkholderia ginsengiterrae]|uniref:Chemotaxis protein CheR n=1 Tax=Paraburkholderia ginsengiterrae TaxID=1462993 RepID=A0ABX2V017_9BURK|nr:protein-glutamate O-methyltransferase CheR [Paraburkholderia ginsengiterrae]OAJ60578.1 chemotaxis protein CheR [Paraburkholderia ginsengiterrae]
MNAHHDNAPLYRHFAELLHRTIGLDAASLGHSAIERAVDQRAAAWYADGHADATLADYCQAAQNSPAILQALIEAVVVPETWFYRDADAFKALAKLARERLDERGTALPLRILSLPCSTGEEPYTIAMTLLDAGIEPTQLRIDAMDISERSLAVARRAVYGRNSFRGNAFPFRDAHFTRAEDGWRLAQRVVETVQFARANLMQLDASALGVYDFVFCRNVLIYFDREAQQTALHVLNSMLAGKGTLFVGPAETGLLMRYGMQSAKIPLAFAFHRGAPEDASLNTWHTAPLSNAAALAMTSARMPAFAPAQVFSAKPFAWLDPVAPATVDAVARDVPRHETTRSTPVGSRAPHARKASILESQTPDRLSSQIAAPTRTASDTLKTAHTLADAGRLEEAATALNTYLAHHAPHAEAFYPLGVLADANSEPAVARAHYRKALYLDPQHAEALAHLATLLELEGDRHGASLLKQRATRAQGAQRG